MRTRCGVRVLVALLAAARAVDAEPEGRAPMTAVLRGDLSPREAFVRAVEAWVEVSATPLVRGGIAVGVARFEAVRCAITVANPFERAVHAVELDVTLGREPPVGREPAGHTRREADDEADRRERTHGPVPITGWRFRLALDEVGPRARRRVECARPLPPLEEAVQPSSMAELSYEVAIVSYRIPSLPLPRALQVIRGGTGADQRAVFTSYGTDVHGAARAFDEQVLLGLLGASPSRIERWAMDELRRSPAAPRTPLEFAFMLQAARRIGGQPALEGLILHETELGEAAPSLGERRDEAHPAENSDLVPANLKVAVHETIVELARHNLAGLYLVLHPNPPPPPPALVAAARELAAAEGLDEPDTWLDAAAALEGGVPQFDPDTDREGRLPIVPVMAKYGGPEVVPALRRALDAEQVALREEAARGLARRGAAGIALLVEALDTEEERRRGPVAAALSSLAGDRRAALLAAAHARGLALDADSAAPAIVRALEAALRAARVRAAGAMLARAEEIARTRPLDDEVPALLARARALSPSALQDDRDRAGRIAARVWRAGAAAGHAGARALLDEVRGLGPIEAPDYRAAVHEARAQEARALAAADLDAALALLGDGPLGPPPERADRATAVAIVLDKVDAAVARGDRRAGAGLLSRARRLGAGASELAGPEARLRALALRQLSTACAVAAVAVLGTGAALLARRHRHRRRRARPA